MIRSSLKKIGKIFLIALLGLIAVINILTIVFSAAGLRNQLEWMPCALLSVDSGSMEPHISSGDMILVYETPYEEIKPGDIITFCDAEGGITTHELICKTENGFIAKGSANAMADPELASSSYCAKLVAVFPGLGGLLEFFTQPVPAIVSIAVILLLFYAVPAVVRLIRRKRNPNQTNNVPVKSTLKNFAAIAVATVFAATPFMTAARYKGNINQTTVIAADAIYFTSNYLQAEGSSANFGGWNGKGKLINIQIRNFSNSLLINQNSDVPYIFYIEKIAESGYIAPQYYTVEGMSIPSEDTAPKHDAEDYHRPRIEEGKKDYILGRYLLPKSELSDGEYITNTHNFNFKVYLNSGIDIDDPASPVKRGETIKFHVMACTDQLSRFYQEISCDFYFTIAESSSFLNQSLTNNQASVDTQIQTTTSESVSQKVVYYRWDTTKMYMNEYSSTAIAILKNVGKGVSYNPEDGLLSVLVMADSKISLDFPKMKEWQGKDLLTPNAYIIITDDANDERLKEEYKWPEYPDE